MMEYSWVRLPAAWPSAVRLPLLLTGNPRSRPAPMFAAPRASSSWLASMYSKPGSEPLLGRQFAVEGGITQLVLRTSRPARVDSYDDRSGALADQARKEGFQSSVGAPIMVEGRVWGALVVLWARREPAPPDTEQRLAQFTEFVGTAVANAESIDADHDGIPDVYDTEDDRRR